MDSFTANYKKKKVWESIIYLVLGSGKPECK